jgi:RNA polymerase sigma factor (sigma-70 family)
MTYATLSAPSQRKSAARQYLTLEQELALVAQIKERNELLKSKKDSLTLEEQRIRLRGERAFNRLVKEYKCLIWSLVNRFSFVERITEDEMYQIAIIAINYAISKHDPDRFGKRRMFSSWVSMKVKCRLIDMYRSELCLCNRTRAIHVALVKNSCFANNQTPLTFSMEEDLRTQLDRIVTSSMSNENAHMFKKFYLEGKQTSHIAMELGTTYRFVEGRNRRSRDQLRKNPRLQELAETYLT